MGIDLNLGWTIHIEGISKLPKNFGQLRETYESSAHVAKFFWHSREIPGIFLFQDAWDVLGSLGIFMVPDDFGHIRKVIFFFISAKNSGHSEKIPDDWNLGADGDNFNVAQSFWADYRGWKKWIGASNLRQLMQKNVQKFYRLAKKICKPEKMFPRCLNFLGRLRKFSQVAQHFPEISPPFQVLSHIKESSMLASSRLEAIGNTRGTI